MKTSSIVRDLRSVIPDTPLLPHSTQQLITEMSRTNA